MGIDSPSRRTDNKPLDRRPFSQRIETPRTEPVLVRREPPLDAPHGNVDNPRDGHELRETEVERMNRWVREDTAESRAKIKKGFEDGFKTDPTLNLDKWIVKNTAATQLAISLTFENGYRVTDHQGQAQRWIDAKTHMADYALAQAVYKEWIPTADDVAKLVTRNNELADYSVAQAVVKGHKLTVDEVDELSTHGTEHGNRALLKGVEKRGLILNQDQINNVMANTPDANIVTPQVIEASVAASGPNLHL